MTLTETRQILAVLATAYDRQLPAGMAEIWAANLSDVPFGLAMIATDELIRTSSYLPKVSDVRERARLVKAAQDRETGKRRQIEGRTWRPSRTPRTGADMVRHVLGRLRDAGSDPLNGKVIGKERCVAVAEAAVAEWLAKTA